MTKRKLYIGRYRDLSKELIEFFQDFLSQKMHIGMLIGAVEAQRPAVAGVSRVLFEEHQYKFDTQLALTNREKQCFGFFVRQVMEAYGYEAWYAGDCPSEDKVFSKGMKYRKEAKPPLCLCAEPVLTSFTCEKCYKPYDDGEGSFCQFTHYNTGHLVDSDGDKYRCECGHDRFEASYSKKCERCTQCSHKKAYWNQ